MAVAALAGGCASTSLPRTIESAHTDGPATQDALLLRAGDVLEIQFIHWPELNQNQAIRPDGKLSLPLVGEQHAEGRTPAQFRDQLLEAYRDKLKDPEINVVVSGLESHRVYVGGEVQAPGVIPLTGRMTPLQAIMQAGGHIKESAQMSNVVVLRREGEQQYAMAIDLAKPMRTPQSEAFFLEPYDIVYVPRTGIDRVNQWVEQYINRIIPRNLHYTFSEVANDSRSESRNVTIDTQWPITVP